LLNIINIRKKKLYVGKNQYKIDVSRKVRRVI